MALFFSFTFFTEIDQVTFHLLFLFFHRMYLLLKLRYYYHCRKLLFFIIISWRTWSTMNLNFSSVCEIICLLIYSLPLLLLCFFLIVICTICARVQCYPEGIQVGMKTTSQVLKNNIGIVAKLQVQYWSPTLSTPLLSPCTVGVFHTKFWVRLSSA